MELYNGIITKERAIEYTNNIINGIFLDDVNYIIDEFVKLKAKVFLSSLITCKDFSIPMIFPTLRNSIQFEWDYSQYTEDSGHSEYFEFEVYSDKISMFYADTTGRFKNTKSEDIYHYGCTFRPNEKTDDIYQAVDFFRESNTKETPITRILDLFTAKYFPGNDKESENK